MTHAYEIYNQHKSSNTRFPDVPSLEDAHALARAYANLKQDAFLRVFEIKDDGRHFDIALSILDGEVSVHEDVTIPLAHW
jgi:hypothetical protein